MLRPLVDQSDCVCRVHEVIEVPECGHGQIGRTVLMKPIFSWSALDQVMHEARHCILRQKRGTDAAACCSLVPKDGALPDLSCRLRVSFNFYNRYTEVEQLPLSPYNSLVKNRMFTRTLKNFLNRFSLVCVGVPGLFILNVLVFIINVRLFFSLMTTLVSGQVLEMNLFTDLSDTVALRMITIGVLILERHEILEMTGNASKDHEHDELADFSRPYGMFYLCGGLIMECFVEQLKHPLRLLEGPVQYYTLLCGVLFFAVLACVVCVGYGMELVSFTRRNRALAGDHTNQG